MFKQFSQDIKLEFAGYSKTTLIQDLLAGLTVAAVALPLALAFGVGSGADAAAGLVTAIIAGFLIGSIGGSSFQISGPTGAMAAILLPLSARFGVEGVLAAGALSGVILLVAALLKAGRIVSIIPSAVITGFTSGIAILIAFGQIDNFFGTTSHGETIIQKISSYVEIGFSPQWQPMFFGLFVLAVMIVWPKKWAAKVPSSLVGIIIALVVNILGPFDVVEVGAIPRSLLLPHRFTLSMLNSGMLNSLIVPAISIAALGMIESLLCGAAGGKMKKERLQADRELIAQGIGNIIIPFLGGVPATAAIARTSVAIKAGGRTRLTSIFHAVTLIASMFLLGPMMSRIPLAALGGVLMMTSWRMNEWDSIRKFFHKKYKTSIAQFLVTMIATVVFDLTIAILIGISLSMILFVIRSSYLEISVANIDSRHEKGRNLTQNLSNVKLVYVTGQLFFGSQDRMVTAIEEISDATTIILSIRGVPSIDHSAMVALEELHESLAAKNVKLLFCGLQPQVDRQFQRAGFNEAVGMDAIFNNAVEAIDSISVV
ncbi:MAG TPA: SulP family inorganic anion transporter [Sphaerochaeta sp.]|nr:SulP family inorganic anion transporter [Sphaerochaeta sp.]